MDSSKRIFNAAHFFIQDYKFSEINSILHYADIEVPLTNFNWYFTDVIGKNVARNPFRACSSMDGINTKRF